MSEEIENLRSILRERRRAIAAQLEEAIESPLAAQFFQEEVASELLLAEFSATQTKGTELYLDMEAQIGFLRSCMDGLVWRTLHPHAIRQLSKNGIRANGLFSQEGFGSVLESAHRIFERTGFPTIVADLTSVIRIGDIIVASDREVPTIVEVKATIPDVKHLSSGRIGRQTSRMAGTTKYLATGEAKVFGEDHIRRELFVDHRASRHWHVIEELCKEAQEEGKAFRNPSPGDYLWVARPDLVGSTVAAIAEAHKSHSRSTGKLGTTEVWGDRAAVWAPVAAWPIESSAKWSLLEGELILYHLVEMDAITGTYDEVVIEPAQGNGTTLRLTYGGCTIMNSRALDDMVYGMETAASVKAGLSLLVRRIEGMEVPFDPDVPLAKPTVWPGEDNADIENALQYGTASDLVAINLTKAKELGLDSWPSVIDMKGLGLMSVESLRVRLDASAKSLSSPAEPNP